MATTEARTTGPFGGYFRRDVPGEDEELTHVGPGTPCGEYFRRFWQPVGLAEELKDLPRAVRILGEDLVLFRDGRGQVGLLDRHCGHRGTSLEYATIESQGLRCCYHGWLYGFDGRVLDTPGEPPESNVKSRFFLGAYPTVEYKGLIFTYMGPPDRRPEFPILDAFNMPGYRVVAEGCRGQDDIQPCNWLQLAENNMDAVHTVFLHGLEVARTSLTGFRPGVNESATIETYTGDGVNQWESEVDTLRDDLRYNRSLEWLETPFGLMYIHAKRLGDTVWVRLADYIMPNIDQIPRTLPLELETQELAFDPPRTTTWTVPVDDTHTMSFGFQYRPEAGLLPSRWRFTSPRTSTERSYEERQREPGDYEGQVSQRAIAVHALEHLGWSDQGVLTVRKLVREGIRAIQRGEEPRQLNAATDEVIPTFGQATVVRVPRAATPEADKALLREIGRKIYNQRLGSGLPTPA